MLENKERNLHFFMKKAIKTAEETATTNEEITLKQETKNNFIIVYDSVYKTKLSADALALLIKLIAAAPTFKPTYEKLQDILSIGKKRLTKAVKELKTKGFLTIENNFNSGSVWTISQEPRINLFKGYTAEQLTKAMIHFELSQKDLKTLLHKKIIDYPTYQATLKGYIKELQRIIKTPWIDE